MAGRRKKVEVSVSRYDIPMNIQDDEVCLTEFDMLPSIPEPNCISLGTHHNEVGGLRNTYCNFGAQVEPCHDMCDLHILNSRKKCYKDQLTGWGTPDCPKMFIQTSGADHDAVYGMITAVTVCCRCGEEYMKYLARADPDDSSLLICEDCFDESYFICDGCGEVFGVDDFEEMGGSQLCPDCYENARICDDCGGLIIDGRDEYWYDDDHTYCESCTEDHTFICASCDERLHTNEMHSDGEGTNICESCYYDVSVCQRCDAFIIGDDGHIIRNGEIYCDSCYSDYRENRGLHDHGHTPSLRFLKLPDEADNKKFFGVEWEIDDGNLDVVDYLDDYEQYVWLTEDGSLSDDGIEIITHPCTIRYHMEELPWKEMVDKCKEYNYRGHKTSNSCGLHVHISKLAFGDDSSEQDRNIAKLLYIVEKFWDQMLIFSRRSQEQVRRWAARYDIARTDTDREIISKCKHQNGGNRYMCVNLQKRATVEMRIFRSTMKMGTILATIQLCDVISDIAINKDLEAIQMVTWDDIKALAVEKNYTELTAYFVDRGL